VTLRSCVGGTDFPDIANISIITTERKGSCLLCLSPLPPERTAILLVWGPESFMLAFHSSHTTMRWSSSWPSSRTLCLLWRRSQNVSVSFGATNPDTLVVSTAWASGRQEQYLVVSKAWIPPLQSSKALQEPWESSRQESWWEQARETLNKMHVAQSHESIPNSFAPSYSKSLRTQ